MKQKLKNGESSVGENIFVISLPVNAIDDPKTRNASYEEALREIGFGRVQVQLLFIIALILLTVLNETMGISFIIPAALCDLNLSESDKGLLSSMTFLGIMISSYFWGYMGDTQGRRIVILTSLLLSTTFTVMSAFVSSFTVFVVCRFMTGVFVSGYSATAYAYIGEFNINKNRATIISWVSVSVGLSAMFMPASAYWILSYHWHFELYDGFQFKPWRLLLLIYTFSGVIGGLCLLTFPESPKFLLTQNQHDEALDIIRWMYRKNKGKSSHDDFSIGKILPEPDMIAGNNYKGAKAIFKSMVDQTIPLFKSPYVLYFFICSFLQFGTFSVAGGMSLFMPDTLNKLSSARNEVSHELRVCDAIRMNLKTSNSSVATVDDICNDNVDLNVFVDSMYMGFLYTIAFIIQALIIKSVGRKTMLLVTLLSSGISGFCLTCVTNHYLIVMLFCFYILFAGINISVINGAACDIFPTHLRSMAVCLSMMAGRLGSAASTNIIGYILLRHCELTYYIFSSMAIACFAAAFIIPS